MNNNILCVSETTGRGASHTTVSTQPAEAYHAAEVSKSTASPSAGRAVAGGAAGALGAITLVYIARALLRKLGTRASLTKRGFLGEERSTASQKQYEKQTKRMPRLDLPELTEEEREAARKRRALSRVTDPEQVQQELADMEVPSNHPWASTLVF